MQDLRRHLTLASYHRYRDVEIAAAAAALHRAELWLSTLERLPFTFVLDGVTLNGFMLEARQSHRDRAIALAALLEPQPLLLGWLDRGGWIIGLLAFLVFTVNTILAGGLSPVGAVSLVLSLTGFVRGALVQQIKEWRRDALETERALLERERNVLDQIAALTDRA